MDDKKPVLQKRVQIAKDNKVMFVWVTIISVVVGFAVVGVIFLVQMLLFNERVLAEKTKTVSVLGTNNKNVTELQNQVRKLDANQILMGNKAKPSDGAIQVILDALPSQANSLALGASLQNNLLTGAALNSLNVDPVAGVESVDSGSSTAMPGEITFSFSVSGDENALRQVLDNLERSIRTIQVDSIKIENQGSVRVMTVQAKAYYELEKTIESKDKTVK